ncbi:MAG TPA: tetratricopeptide repeat protein [Vicinamibacterales bacterium]|nr:tetratricopeptide repeat protein [Vicinamibacterales bacterium]
MRERVESPSHYSWIVYAVAMLIIGGLAGYILANAASRPSTGATPQSSLPNPQAPAPVVAPAASMTTFADAVDAGNRFYDAQRYEDAIPYYQKALSFNANDVNVSTDLGTALWYVGRADAALAQYDHSLSLDRTHAQTLFNVGVVRADGKHDYAGAIDAWESLLRANPAYPAADKVRSLIGDAQRKLRT